MKVRELIDVLNGCEPEGEVELYQLDHETNDLVATYYIERISEGNIIKEVFIEIKPVITIN